jgi:hypothetical protein
LLTSHTQRWLDIVARIGRQAGWDGTLIIPMEIDDRTLNFQVRKSALGFMIKQEGADAQRFSISYTEYARGTPLDTTLRRIDGGRYRSPSTVDQQLEQWLLGSVARYVADRGLLD